MAIEAVKLRPLREADPVRVQKKERARVRKQREDDISTKTFEQLTKAEKDKLLKAVAIKLGLIEDSDDGA